MTARYPLLALLPGCIFVSTSPEQIHSETTTLDVPVTGLQFDLPAGDVSIHREAVERVEVTWTLHYRGALPTTTAQVSADILYLEGACPEFHHNCSIDIDVAIPADVWVAGETGAGDIDVWGVTAGVDLDSGSGDVDLHDIVGFVGVFTGAGDVRGHLLDSATVWVECGAGDVDIEVTSEIDEVTIDTGAGDVDLQVPQGTYAVQASTGAGNVAIEGITSVSGADARLWVETGAGNITIRGF